MKKRLIDAAVEIVAWIDTHILDHRFYSVCCWITNTEWFDEGDQA